jgi:excisionase family DNA binding protein
MDKLTYNVEETGKALGLSRASAYKAVHDGSIPTIRLGRRLVVPRVQLEKLLNGKPEDAKQIEHLAGKKENKTEDNNNNG